MKLAEKSVQTVGESIVPSSTGAFRQVGYYYIYIYVY